MSSPPLLRETVAEAEALLPRFEQATRNQAATGADFGSTSLTETPLPRLIRLAETTARAGNHSLASRLFRMAFLALQAQLIFVTIRHDASLSTGPASRSRSVASFERGIFAYPEAIRVFNMMRDILSFYHRLERDRPEIAGAALGFILEREIRARYILAGDSARPMIAEVAGIDTPRGPGLRIFGANNQSVDVTRLPGTPDPREVGAHSFQHQELGRIEAALYGQVEFMHEVEREPEVRRAFGSTAIDMNNLEHRIRVWRCTAPTKPATPPGWVLWVRSCS